MSITVTRSGIEIASEQNVGELDRYDLNVREDVSPLVPFIQECTMCHSIWDYYSEMTECPKCKTKFKIL
ncbi:hypothetical protein [Desulfosporosinus sp. SB140]|uniref:hypothetical protein n=1 Tax=Desulfosporosinus paludis TaxID=3115649 RepID=UPI00388D1CA2